MIPGIKNLIILSDYDIRRLIFQVHRQFIQVILIFQLCCIFGNLPLYFFQYFFCNTAVIFYRINKRGIIFIQKPKLCFRILYMTANQQKRDTCEQKRNKYDRKRCDHKPCSEFHENLPFFLHIQCLLYPDVLNIPHFSHLEIKHLL